MKCFRDQVEVDLWKNVNPTSRWRISPTNSDCSVVPEINERSYPEFHRTTESEGALRGHRLALPARLAAAHGHDHRPEILDDPVATHAIKLLDIREDAKTLTIGHTLPSFLVADSDMSLESLHIRAAMVGNLSIHSFWN
jgi:hypothetical protein